MLAQSACLQAKIGNLKSKMVLRGVAIAVWERLRYGHFLRSQTIPIVTNFSSSRSDLGWYRPVSFLRKNCDLNLLSISLESTSLSICVRLME